MKGIKSLKLGLAGFAAGALLLAGGLLVVSQVAAASGTLTVTDGTAAPGEQATVELIADVEAPGLGAWTVDISYDPDVLAVVSCEPEQGGVCNPEFADDAVRITGASASGIEGEESLGAITFECTGADEASSDIETAVEVFADATIGDPQDIDVSQHHGHVACEEAEPTAAAATATPLPGPPTTGMGGSSTTDFSWLIASLAGLGVAALAGYGVLRVRTRSW
jgi:hypothetical protein